MHFSKTIYFMKRLFPVMIVVMLAACSGYHVIDTGTAEGFKLQDYKTFDFYQLEGRGDTSKNFKANTEVLKQAITKQLQAKGLQPSSSNPDLLVNIGVVVEEKIQTRETTLRDAHY